MAAPVFQDVGTPQAGGALAFTVPWPTHQVDDIAILFMESVNAPGLATPNGFVRIPDAPQTTTVLPTVLDAYWCRATSTSMASPVTNTFTNHGYAVIVTFRGCITTGDPWDVTSGGIEDTSNTSLSITGDTTTIAECLIVYLASRGFDSVADQYSGEADSSVANLAERVDAGTAAGNGGGLGMWTGDKATAGAYGPLTATLANSATDAFISIALKPPAAGGATGTVAVTQDDQTSAVDAVETFAATSAATQDAQTPTASGSVLNPATGSAAVTQDDQTAAATGLETITGTVAVTQADQTSSAAGAETITGTAAPTQADQTSTATGVFGSAASGTAAVTQDDQTSTASGTVVVVISGAAAVTQADQTSTATAVETFTGTSANVQADQGSAATGVLGIAGSSATTQADQTSTATGTSLLAVTGTVAVTQQDQFSTATGIGGILTFWSANPVPFTTAPVSHTKAPVAFVPVGGGDDPPW